MKKQIYLLLFSMLFALTTMAQPQLTYKFANPEIIRTSGVDYFQFDVFVMGSSSGTYFWSLQLNFSFNNTALSQTAAQWLVVPGTLMAGTNSASNPKYTANPKTITGTAPNKVVNIKIGGDINVFPNGPNGTDFNLMPTSYAQLCTVKAQITDATLASGVLYKFTSMNGQESYVSGPSAFTKYVNPNLYDPADFASTYIGRLFGAANGWSQAGGTVDGQFHNWTANVNTSVWDGSATIDQTDNTIAFANNLRIESAATLTVPPNKWLTVALNMVNMGTATNFVINSGGSVISTAITGNITQERAVTAWTSNTDGWHFLSSPVASQAISPNFIDPTATLYDFYGWGEASGLWLNYKAGSISSNMIPGTGYLIAYGTSGTKTFSGAPNLSDIPLSNLSYTIAMPHYGWHLIGNPFQSAVTWNDGNWGLSNVQANAARLNPGGTYSTLFPGGYLPAENGLMIWVSTGTNNLTIPKASRVHNVTGWYKSSEELIHNYLMLTAASTTDNTYVETVVGFNPNSSAEYDLDYDSWFLSGLDGTPWMYSTTPASKYLSANIMPAGIDSKVVPVGFKKGNSGSYTMTASWIESFDPGVTITLEDLKAQKVQDIVHNPVYAFTSEDGDVQNRFLLHFGGIFGIDEQGGDQSVSAYSVEHSIYVTNNTGKALQGIIIYDMLGKELVTKGITEGKLTKINLPGVPTGNYLIRVLTDQKPYTRSLFIH